MEGIVNIFGKRCVGGGCIKQPRYGVTESRKPEYCAGHALKGMVNILHKKCIDDGCTKQNTYGMLGSRKPESCAGLFWTVWSMFPGKGAMAMAVPKNGSMA